MDRITKVSNFLNYREVWTDSLRNLYVDVFGQVPCRNEILELGDILREIGYERRSGSPAAFVHSDYKPGGLCDILWIRWFKEHLNGLQEWRGHLATLVEPCKLAASDRLGEQHADAVNARDMQRAARVMQKVGFERVQGTLRWVRRAE